jgi:mannan endo-1,4-beta-mannosidase
MLPSLQTAPGKYNMDVLEGLDFLLSEMSKRDMVAVMCMNDFWNWSGGMAQYLVWAGAANSIRILHQILGATGGNIKHLLHSFIVNEKAVELFNNHLRFIVNRKNSITGKLYKDDPTIFSWN